MSATYVVPLGLLLIALGWLLVRRRGGHDLYDLEPEMFPTCSEEQQMLRDLPALMREAHEEIISLRISVARIAQAAGVSLSSIGLPCDAGYELLRAKAASYPLGWNSLAGETIDAIHGTSF